MFGESEAQRMRLRLGSVFEELVALRQAAMAVADALDRAAWLRQPRYLRDAVGRLRETIR
jgi:hypothetical protein